MLGRMNGESIFVFSFRTAVSLVPLRGWEQQAAELVAMAITIKTPEARYGDF